MALGELIYANDTLNQGRIKINNFYSGGTVGIIVSGSGTYSAIRTDPNVNLGNAATAQNSFAAGFANRASGLYSISFWGTQNSATTPFSAVIHGKKNVSSSQGGVILGGYKNALSASSTYSLILNGKNNIVDSGSKYATIINGKSNLAKGNYSMVSGLLNSAFTQHNVVIGGRYNSVSGNSTVYSNYYADNAIIGGGGKGDYQQTQSIGKNTIKGSGKSVILGGIAGNIYNSISSAILASGLYTNGGYPSYSLLKREATISGGSQNSIILSSVIAGINGGRKSSIIGSTSANITNGNSNGIFNSASASIGASGTYNSAYSSIISSTNSKIPKANNSVILASASSTISGITGGGAAAENVIIGSASSNLLSHTFGPLLRNGILGGLSNSIIGTGGTIQNHVILGGSSNSILTTGTSNSNAIIGGYSNTINRYIGGTFGGNVIVGGSTNKIHNRIAAANTQRNFIGGGNLNFILSTATTASNNAIIGGFGNTANTSNSAILAGKNNGVGHAYSVAMGGGSMTRAAGGLSDGTCQLVIGNQPTLPAASNQNRIRLDAMAGQGIASVSFVTGTADYAEYFEWLDKNINKENRLGYFVSLIDGKVQIGNSNIIGIVSSAPGFIGDAAELAWDGMYIKDEWNREIPETYKTYSWNENEEHTIIFEDINGRKMTQHPNPGYPTGLDFNGVIPMSAITGTTISLRVNPNYSPNNDYTPRSQRPEWSPVGLLGKLHVRTAEPITGKSIDVNAQGLAINGNKFMVLNTVRPHTDSQYGIVRVFFK